MRAEDYICCSRPGCTHKIWASRRNSKEDMARHEAQVHVFCTCGRSFSIKLINYHLAQMRFHKPAELHEIVAVPRIGGVAVARSVMQDWTQQLTFMMQSVLLTAVRGPDGLHKDHISKVLLRWYRRCILISAFEGRVMGDPYTGGGGSFTGPCVYPTPESPNIDAAVSEYLRASDEIPHHFLLHLQHAAEILGYKHPEAHIREFWHRFYLRSVNDAHMNPETEAEMDYRLGDSQEQWRAREEVTAK